MKLLAIGLILFCGCFMAVLTSDAQAPSTGPSARNNPHSRGKVRPQFGPNRINGQATRRSLSPAPGRAKTMSRVTPAQRLAHRQKGHKDKSFTAAETRIDGLGKNNRGIAHDAPRGAMTRSFSKRLSQIDKIRDKALETGDLDLLDLADRLELGARRKFEEMMARMDQRRELGKPGIGSPVLLPAVEPTPELETPEMDQPTGPTALPDSEAPSDSDLPDTSLPESDAATEPTVTAEPETT